MGSISAGSDAELKGLVTFKVGEEEFGVDILSVETIIRMMEITKVPRSPDFVEGVINLRGSVIPIIDFRKRFQMKMREEGKDTRIIVTNLNAKQMGFIVDSVSEVLRIPVSAIVPPPPIVAGIDAEYINGVGKLDDRLLILINIERLFSDSEKSALESVAG
jgi:purine-binding chemotaxis protein CheW